MPTHHDCADNRRFYQIGGMTICVESGIAITEKTFHTKFKRFERNGAGEKTVFIRHHFFIPELYSLELGVKVHQHPPLGDLLQQKVPGPI